MYYLVKVRFDVISDTGKIKKVKEQHLIYANSIGEAEAIANKKFAGGISTCYIEAIQESKILSVLD